VSCFLICASICHVIFYFCVDIVDIKPTNMEELTEVITAAEFHPLHCNLFVYSSSKGTIRLCDMRERALCDHQAMRMLLLLLLLFHFIVLHFYRIRRTRRSVQSVILFGDYFKYIGCEILTCW
jgi:hypothetical protein